MILHTGPEVTFVYEKVQKQLGSSDCGLFALAFARLVPRPGSRKTELQPRNDVQTLCQLP